MLISRLELRNFTFGCFLALLLVACESSSSSTDSSATSATSSALSDELVEVGCATCMYDMEGVEGCVTAVKVNDIPHLLDGVELDAHATGLCSSVKQAKVTGSIENDKFVASKIDLMEESNSF